MDSGFFAVIHPADSPEEESRHIYDNRADAEADAIEMASHNVGKHFFVMTAVADVINRGVEVSDVQPPQFNPEEPECDDQVYI